MFLVLVLHTAVQILCLFLSRKLLLFLGKSIKLLPLELLFWAKICTAPNHLSTGTLPPPRELTVLTRRLSWFRGKATGIEKTRKGRRKGKNGKGGKGMGRMGGRGAGEKKSVHGPQSQNRADTFQRQATPAQRQATYWTNQYESEVTTSRPTSFPTWLSENPNNSSSKYYGGSITD